MSKYEKGINIIESNPGDNKVEKTNSEVITEQDGEILSKTMQKLLDIRGEEIREILEQVDSNPKLKANSDTLENGGAKLELKSNSDTLESGGANPKLKANSDTLESGGANSKSDAVEYLKELLKEFPKNSKENEVLRKGLENIGKIIKKGDGLELPELQNAIEEVNKKFDETTKKTDK